MVALFTLLAIISGLASSSAMLLVLRRVRREKKRQRAAALRAQSGNLPPISILKPLSGLDERLIDNLRSFIHQDYPAFEILFGVEDPADPALEVVAQLQREFPSFPMRKVVMQRKLGFNPKVNNLASMADKARYNYLLISDANVAVQRDYLRNTMADMEGLNVGLTSNLITGCRGQSVGAIWEDLTFNSFVACATVLVTDVGRQPLVVGKSMLFRKRDLSELGGFAALRNILAEDYMMGVMYRRANKRVVLSSTPVEAVHEQRTLNAFLQRHVRWAQTRRRLSLPAYLGELLLHPTLWLSLLGISALVAAKGALAAAAAGGFALKLAADALLYRQLTGQHLKLAHVLLIPGKDLCLLGVWAVGLFLRQLNWRGHLLQIGAGSVISPVPAKILPAPFPAPAPTGQLERTVNL